jgi:spermidine synthase
MFPRMVEMVQPGNVGKAEVDHYEVSKHESAMSAWRRGDYCPPGKYARLLVDNHLVMSDTSMERYSNVEFLRHAHGNVLVAGLGLGMILHPALAKPEVAHITVIEKYQDVIDLIAPTLPSGELEIICADIFEWTPVKGRKWNVIYFDIWPDICTGNLEDMAKMHQRFKGRLDRTDSYCWMSSWMRDRLKAERRKDR